MIILFFVLSVVTKERLLPSQIIEPHVHGIDIHSLDEGVLGILSDLRDAGYDAYLVGGCIRDLLAGHKPKDFDVVTNARPEQIRKVFPKKSMIIGRRFALVHVRLGWHRIVEVATFRGKHADRVVRNKVGKWLSKWWIYGNMDSDVWRRDATINALYMSYPDGHIMDHVGGFDDIQRRQVRMIGDPATRFQEDPVRLLRVVRLQAKLGFHIETATWQHIRPCRDLLLTVSPNRMYGELVRTFHGGFAVAAFDALNKVQMLRILMPNIDLSPKAMQFVRHCLHNADERVANNLPLSASFLYALFLWHPLQKALRKSGKGARRNRFDQKSKALLQRQHRVTALPKRVWFGIVQIWRMQAMFAVRSHSAAAHLSEHGLFRAAYDFYLLRAHFEPELLPWSTWWQAYLEASSEEKLVLPLPEIT